MTTSLTWIRDKYDTNKNRYIEKDEAVNSLNDRLAGRITVAEYEAVQAVYVMKTLLPAYTTKLSSAKGKIVNFSYPTSAKKGERISIRASVQNTGGTGGYFKLQLIDGTCKLNPTTNLYDSNCRIAQSTQFMVSANKTSSLKSIYVTTPSSTNSISYKLACVRVK